MQQHTDVTVHFQCWIYWKANIGILSGFFSRNLDETTRVVYTENIALAEKLNENIKEEELLKRVNKRLKEENSLLEADAENNKAVVKEKQSDSQRKAAKIKEVYRGI